MDSRKSGNTIHPPTRMNTYASMSLVELKKVAKTRRIKMYYTKKRHELIRLLSLPELPDSYTIEKYTIVQLRQQAKERNIGGIWKLTREQLVNVLYPLPQQHDQNNDDTHEHNSPQTQDCHQVREQEVK